MYDGIGENIAIEEKTTTLLSLNEIVVGALARTQVFGQWWEQHAAMFRALQASGGLRIERNDATIKSVKSLKKEWMHVRDEMGAYVKMIRGGAGSGLTTSAHQVP